MIEKETLDSLREQYGVKRVENATKIMGMMLDRMQDMAETMAVMLDNCGDQHGARVMRLFKESLKDTWHRTVEESETIQ